MVVTEKELTPLEALKELKKGHEYTEENTGYTSQGYRYCKTCKELKRPIYNAHRREQRRLSKNG